ncbi:hypothetical protein HYPBUDRAFT_144371 [Hyphopichia burtonii NRRL Y-1933]|uniref:Uncharacterized protein n=1 Tax=Hyphopichia burtonii NRRL Y-1933 TaxID=984485 RepID=A0A1E4RDB1_9ASCO|nr:hypothetical protein HYPBUDRAFT_144371 [Hyphopichia burtonii NRRL Y-1933]ODV65247.1 hypothetical protein HYPBUDRAFT_144371 [Hyphopichia burtonii NRRL Y-1933]
MDLKGIDHSESIKSDSVYSGSTGATPASLAFDDEQPNFEVEQVQLQFDLNNSLGQLKVQNNIMYLISNEFLYKIDLENPSEVKLVPLPTPFSDSNQVTNSWVHPNGLHLIIQVNHKYYYYLHKSYSKFKIISRFKNLNIQFITFPYDLNASSYENTTGDFLIGSSDGTIYIALLKAHDPFTQENKRDDKYIKQVYKYSLSSSNPNRIAGLTFTNNIQINLVIDNQLLTWDCFETSYSELVKVFKIPPRISSLPSSSSPSSASTKSSSSTMTNNPSNKIIFDSTLKNYNIVIPSSKKIQSNDPEFMLSQSESLNIGNYSLSSSRDSFISTNHHFIFLNNLKNSLVILNKLSNSDPLIINLSSKVNPDEKILGLIADNLASTYWLYTNNNIYEIIISNESVSVWFNYYKLGNYEEALKCLDAQEVSNPFKKDMVLIKQGYDYLQKGGFGVEYSNEEFDSDLLASQIKGIRVLAELSEPFEKICLMLLNLQQSLSSKPKSSPTYMSETLLIEYLMVKFNLSVKIEKNRIRSIVLSSWIVELMLRVLHNLQTEINSITVNNKKEEDSHDGDSKTLSNKTNLFESLDNQLQFFLNENFKILDAKTIYQIMKELNYPSKLIAFADLIKDYEFILNYYIDISNWDQALQTLIKIYKAKHEDSKEVIYKNSTVLLVNEPKLTIETWLKFDDLDYTKLLPAILTYNKNNKSIPLFENHTIHFLLKVIFERGIKNEFIINYYCSLLITYPVSSSQTSQLITKQLLKVLTYIKNETISKKNQVYDSDLILRLCLRYEQYHPAILILMNDMTLFEQALRLALKHDLTDLAELVLKRHDEYVSNELDLKDHDDYEFIYKNTDAEENIEYVGKIKLEEESFSSRKKLWMLFAKHLIEGICNGKSYKILDTIDGIHDFDVLSTDKDTEKTLSDQDSVKDITNNLLQSLTGDSSKDRELLTQNEQSKLNKVLKYLLNSSYSNKANSNVLSLKDLLPLFPESIMINNFKDEIVSSLNQYNNRINQLTLEMQESSKIAHQLKEQIKDSTSNHNKGKIYTIIEPGESCKLCHNLLIDKNFICFANCHHNFHKECLVRYYLKLKGDYRFKKVFQDFKRNSSVANKKEVDDIMLKDCVLCNESNINTIDTNIIDLSSDREKLSEWVL